MSRLHVAECLDCGWSKTYQQAGRAAREAARHTCPEPARQHRRSCRTCGWSGSYSSAAVADWCKRKHSCARWIAKAESKARGDARRAAVDRTPKPCLHPRTTHVHGTHACYVLDKCKCDPCSKANSTYEQQRARLHAYGRWQGYVDAAPARDHIHQLMAQGMGYKRVAALAGVAESTLGKLIWGDPHRNLKPCARIRPATEAKILAVALDLAPGAKVPAVGSQRRIQALVALGYSLSELGRRLGIGSVSNLTAILERPAVMRRTAEKITALYDEISMLLPPEQTHRQKISASRARNLAKARGWAPPLAWDDDDIDDPTATPDLPGWRQASKLRDDEPDEAAIERRRLGDKSVRLSRAEKDELVRRMTAVGISQKEITRLTGVAKPERHRQTSTAPRFCSGCAKTPAPDREPCHKCDGYRRAPRSIDTDDDITEIPTRREDAAA